MQELDKNYDVVDKIQEEFNKRLTDETFIGSVLGGVLGAGRAVVNGVFQTFTILILTLYFLASLPKMKRVAYSMVPASRRNRIAQAQRGDHAAHRVLRHRPGRDRDGQRGAEPT